MSCVNTSEKKAAYDIHTDPVYAPAYDFYRDIATAIRLRELNASRPDNPLTKLPEEEQKAFDELRNIPVVLDEGKSDDDNTAGMYYPKIPWYYPGRLIGLGGEKIRLMTRSWVPWSKFPRNISDQDKARNLVHELRHALATRINFNNYDALQNIYGFRGLNLSSLPKGYTESLRDEEMATTNKEQQFIQYMQCRRLLGRAPTADEYFSYIKEKPIGDIKNTMQRDGNGYQEAVDKAGIPTKYAPNVEDGSDEIRKAMTEITSARPAIGAEQMKKTASNFAANAIDWYVNKLNELHLIPVNAATLVRDISSKQLSDGNFTPRPLTIKNFTNPELDALYRLATDNAGMPRTITGKVYDELYKEIKGDPKAEFSYGKRDDNKNISDYVSPLRAVSTTLGQAVVKTNGADSVIEDTFDFNRKPVKVFNDGMGTVWVNGRPWFGNEFDKDDLRQLVNQDNPENGGNSYHRFRNNAAELGHNSEDPDHQKIHASLSLSKIKDKLGDRLGTYDVLKSGNKKDFVLRSAGAGALTGAPIGTLAGGIVGALLMTSKKFRKRWYLHAMLPMLAGGALGAAIGGTGAGLSASKIWDRFDKGIEKKSESVRKRKKDVDEEKRDRRRAALVASLVYPLSGLALLGAAGYAGFKSRPVVEKIYNKLYRNVDNMRDVSSVSDAKDMSESFAAK